MVNDTYESGGGRLYRPLSLPSARSIYVIYSEIIHNARVREGSERPAVWLRATASAGYNYDSGFVSDFSFKPDIGMALKLYRSALYFLRDLGAVVELEGGYEYDLHNVIRMRSQKKLGASELLEPEVAQLKRKISDLERRVTATSAR